MIHRIYKMFSFDLHRLLALSALVTLPLEAATLSFNNSEDFDNQFTRNSGTGENRFEEIASIGVGGSRALQRSSSGTETISYAKNGPLGGLTNAASVSLRFKYSTNSTGSGGVPLFFGITTNVNYDGTETNNQSDDFIGVELSQRLTGSNESKIVLFNGNNGIKSVTADSGFENLTPGWYEIEISLEQVSNLFDLSVAMHRLSSDGVNRVSEDVVTAAVSSLTNGDLLNASNLYFYFGGSDTLTRGVEIIDEIKYLGIENPEILNAPSNLIATVVSESQIDISWVDNSDNETNFRVERRQGAGKWSEIVVLAANTTSYSNTGLPAETNYSYRVLAFNSIVSSSSSNEATATTTGAPIPNPPSDLVASAFSLTQVDLTWTDNSNNENSFRIERKVGEEAFSKLIDTSGDLENFSDTGLTPNTTYTYRIFAENVDGTSASSNEASITTPILPVPVGPSNLRITSSSVTQVSLAWDDNSNDELGFRIERKTGLAGYEQVAELPAGSLSFDDIEVQELGDYTYRVLAFNANGSSGFSNLIEVDLPFLPPSNLVALAVSSTQVDFTWDGDSTIKTGFRIERKVDDGPYITLVNVGGDIFNFSDVTVSSQTNYTYRILAISFEEFSEYSNQASVSTPALLPSQAPANLEIDSQGLDNVILSWNDTSSDEIGFRIQRAIGDGAFETLDELDQDTTQYGDFEVNELGEYSYRIVSYNDAGESTPSNEVSTQIEFRQPTNLLALAISSSQVDLSWQDNSFVETGYLVERKAGDGNFEILIQLDSDVEAYSDNTVTPLSTYTYRITGISGSDMTNTTNEFSTTTPNIAEPGAASDLVAILVDSSFIALTWSDNSVTENGYYVERMVGSGAWETLTQLAANSTSVQDLQVSELETFVYRVIAFNDGGESTTSNEAAIFFDIIPPSGLTANATNQGRIDLTWNDNSLVEMGYRIDRKVVGGDFEALTTTDPGVSSFVDGTTTVDVTYIYRVVGLFDGGESDPSNEDLATTTPDTTKPESPTGLAASVMAYNEINLTWVDNSDNESGFRFERKIGEGGEFSFVGNSIADSTSYTDTNLNPDTTYIYRISAFVEGAQVSDPSSEASATTTSVPIPEVPLNLAIVDQNFGEVSLSWEDTSEIETGFRIQRKIGNGVYEDLEVFSENAIFFNDSTVVEFTEYSYRVNAYNSSGDSAFSNEISVAVPFASPRLLTGEAVNSYEVHLDWDDTSLVETGYRLERKSAEGDYAVIGIFDPNSTLYVDDSVAPNQTYSYRVFAVKNGSDSLPSILVNITTPNIPAPMAPTELQVTVLSDTSISINWTDNSNNEDGFRIYRKEVSTEVWVEIGDVIADVNLFVDDDVVAGINYSYRVLAYNQGGSESPIESGALIPVPGRLINISTRGLVETGDNVMIGSFVIQGDGPKTVYIRGIGPSIASGINASILEDPEITLVSGADLNRPIAYNDDWRDINEKTIVDLGLPPQSDREAAIVIKLQPGAYSAILSGVDFTSGFGLIEVYEVDFSKNIRMVNISTRSFVQEGDKRMIGGFFVSGDTPTRVYIKASGPSLPSTIENLLVDPVIELFSGQERIDINDNWEQSPRIAEIFATGIAPSNSNEAAIVATLEPGPYTAIVGGANDSSGYSLLEIYYYPE